MTAEVKDELSRLVVSAVSARRAEVTSLLRFAGGLHIVAGRVVVEAEVDLGSIARRLRKDIFDLYGYNAVVHVLSASGIPRRPVTCCGSQTMARRWPARPGCSICVVGRCAVCPRRSSAAASATLKPRGVERSWHTVR